MTEDETITVDDLREDLASVEKRVASFSGKNHVEGKHLATLLQQDVVPLLASLVEKVAQQEEALLSVFEEGELLMPETAATLLASLEAGEALAAFIDKVGPGLTDIEHAEAKKLVETYRNVRALAEKAVQELVEDEPPEDAGADGEPEPEEAPDDGAGEQP